MRISVIIPTWNRPQLLRKTILSLEQQSHRDYNLIVIVDGNKQAHKAVVDMTGFKRDFDLILNERRRDWIWSMNYALEYLFKGDAFVYASDDLEFDRDCLKLACARLFLKAPDGDGLVPINQDVAGCETAFGIAGAKFARRFPKRHVFCPDYIHYCSDHELGKFARRIGRMYRCPGATVKHHRLKDETFRLAKALEQRDLRAQTTRYERGWTWGINFERITSGDGPRP